MATGKLLYLGTDPTHYATVKEMIHYPIIDMTPRDFRSFSIAAQFADMREYTHIIFTSKTAVHVFMEAMEFYHIPLDSLKNVQWICIGASTDNVLRQYGIKSSSLAQEETQDGVIKLIDLLNLEDAYLFYPRSSRARPTLSCYLKIRQLRHQICDLYDTKAVASLQRLDLTQVDEVVFTSPSTVEAFFEMQLTIPPFLKFTPIGPITAEAIKTRLSGNC